MGKIQLYWGPLPNNLLNKQTTYTLQDLFDENGRLNVSSITSGEERRDKFVIAHEDYGLIKEFVYEHLPKIINVLFLSDCIDECIIQNPPKLLHSRFKSFFDMTDIEDHEYTYEKIDNKTFINIEKILNESILGQKHAIDELLSVLYMRKINMVTKPLVVLLYGQEGVGKTETAKMISQQIYQHELFRKQLSMFQTHDFGEYMFGSTESHSSFAKDLLMRKSNVILLDEFDKCPSLFYSAFYQLFDEGIFEDKNHKVSMKNSIILCTSNYKSKDEIKAFLGGPIYSRFDAIIGYAPLSKEVKEKLVRDSYYKNLGKFPEEDQQIIQNEVPLDILISKTELFQNVREIDKWTKLVMANKSMKTFLNNNRH